MACRAGAEPEEVERRRRRRTTRTPPTWGRRSTVPMSARRIRRTGRRSSRGARVDAQPSTASWATPDPAAPDLVRVAVGAVLDEVDGRPVGQLDEGVGEPLPEPPLAEGGDQRAGRGPELRRGASARHRVRLRWRRAPRPR